jgi:hypothetical protein
MIFSGFDGLSYGSLADQLIGPATGSLFVEIETSLWFLKKGVEQNEGAGIYDDVNDLYEC